MSKNIAIVSAMPEELVYVEEYLAGRADWQKTDDDLYENKEKELRLATKILGVGKVNAAYQTADLITSFQPELLINVGYAGGLIKGAKTGDVAIGSDYVQVDFEPYLDVNRPQIDKTPSKLVKQFEKTAQTLEITAYAGKIATGDFFLHDSGTKQEIITKYQAIAFDMESAAIAQVATAKGVEFISLRTFSDLADETALELFEQTEKEKRNRIPIERRPVVLAIEVIEAA